MAKDATAPQKASLHSPPSYDETLKSEGGPTSAGFYPPLPPQYSETPQQHVRLVYVQAPDFGPNPVKTTCPACQASVTTSTRTKPSVMAWAISAVLCFTMLWPCFCVPFCVDSLQDVKHRCPACRATIGRYRGV